MRRARCPDGGRGWLGRTQDAGDCRDGLAVVGQGPGPGLALAQVIDGEHHYFSDRDSQSRPGPERSGPQGETIVSWTRSPRESQVLTGAPGYSRGTALAKRRRQ